MLTIHCGHTHTQKHTYPHTQSDAQWSGNEKNTNAKNATQSGTKIREKGPGKVGSGFSLDLMSKAVNSQKALQWLATTTGKGEGGCYHGTAPSRQAHNCDTGRKRWRQPADSGTRRYGREASAERLGQSLSSGFWGSMILTWVNGKRPLRPFTSPSHWPLMFIRVTLTMSPTWEKEERKQSYRRTGVKV